MNRRYNRQKHPKLRKPQQLHVVFPFRPISANNLTRKNSCNNGATRAYKRFSKRVMQALVKKGFKRGSVDLRGELKLRMKVGFSCHQADLDNCLKGLIDTLVVFFGGWDDHQIQEIHITKHWVDTEQAEFTEVLLTKTGRN